MSGRFLAALLTMIGVVLLVPVLAIGQVRPSQARNAKWEQPRTAWGDPDLQGIWNNVTATPLERSAEFKDREVLTNEEAAEYARRAVERQVAGESKPITEQTVGQRTGYSATVWFETSHALSGNRTSLLLQPKDGHLPPLIPEAQKMAERLAQARRVSPADGPEDLGPYTQCITRGLPGAMMPGFYNHNYQILQEPGYVVIVVEMIHDARIIPMDGRPHLDTGVRQWLGDPRGRWEGNTLVVETTNLRDIDQRNVGVFGTTARGRVIERFTRLGPDAMDYQVTVDDPGWYTQSWTASIPMTKVPGPIYEYACHEGNYAMPGILAGQRKEEREAAQQR